MIILILLIALPVVLIIIGIVIINKADKSKKKGGLFCLALGILIALLEIWAIFYFFTSIQFPRTDFIPISLFL
jgi:hypothetical protein